MSGAGPRQLSDEAPAVDDVEKLSGRSSRGGPPTQRAKRSVEPLRADSAGCRARPPTGKRMRQRIFFSYFGWVHSSQRWKQTAHICLQLVLRMSFSNRTVRHTVNGHRSAACHARVPSTAERACLFLPTRASLLVLTTRIPFAVIFHPSPLCGRRLPLTSPPSPHPAAPPSLPRPPLRPAC